MNEKLKNDLFYVFTLLVIVIVGIMSYKAGIINGKYELCKDNNKHLIENSKCVTCDEIGMAEDYNGNCVKSQKVLYGNLL